MAISTKSVLAVAGAALLLGACAAEPYDYGYPYGNYAANGAYEDYPGYYVAPPVVGFGFGFSEFDHRDHRRDRHEGREHHGDHHEWHGDHDHEHH
jgi:hypothetical protein